MCGLVGCNNPSKYSMVKDSLSKMDHRGPDYSMIIKSNNIIMGHNTLRITGNSPIVQPIEISEFLYSVNGEFYDYLEIKKKFPFGYIGDSDSEILSPLLEIFDVFGMMKYLNGEFAIVVYDKSKNVLSLIRDRLGNKPLYYKVDGGEIVWGSELKIFDKDINEKKFIKQLSIQYLDSDETIYNEIKQVKPGHILQINLNNFSITENRYFDFYKNELDVSFGDAKDIIYDEIESSVTRRMFNKTPAISLGGGIDSSIIYHHAFEQNKNIKTYSVIFDDDSIYNESKYINELVKNKNNHTNILLNPSDLLRDLKDSIIASEGVSINLHVAAKYRLFKTISEDNRVCLSGEGSDEFFFGYEHFKSGISDYSGMHTPSGEILGNKYLDENIPMFLKAKLSQGHKLMSLLNKDYVNDNQDLKSFNKKRLFDGIKNDSYHWSTTCLNNYILSVLGDKLEMNSSVENRTPFLDKNLLDVVMALPTKYKMNGNIEKYILKETYRNKIPNSIINKTKHPFVSPPLLGWDNGIFKEFFNDEIGSLDTDIFNINEIKNILNSNDKSYDTVIMLLYSSSVIRNL